ncbi:MAG: S1C family serine protease, partial [Oscillospiraceae bacterium]
MSKDDNTNDVNDYNVTNESGIANAEDFFDDIEEEEDEATMLRKFPAWVIVAVTMVVLVSFIAISLPDLSLFIGGRFDFLSQNASLENDPLVLAARDTVVSITAMGVKNLPETSRAGTGFLFSADGHILTNLHVVEGAQKIKVELENGDVYYAKNYLPLLDLDVVIIDID